MQFEFPPLQTTPLKQFPNNFGIKNLFVKDETTNITHTFKDRLAHEMLSPILNEINLGKQITKTTFGSISYGNTAFSMGNYCDILNDLFGSEVVNAISFIPLEIKSKTFGPDTSGKHMQASEMLNKVNNVCHLIEIDLTGKVYRENDLKVLARNSGYCYEKYIDVTEGLNRVSYEGVISEVIEQQFKQVPDYIIVPFGAGILCDEIKDYIQDHKLSSKVIPVSSGNPDTIAIMLYGPIWVNCKDLLKNGKTLTNHDKIDRKGRIRESYCVYNVNDYEILSILPQLNDLNISCEPSAASGFAILHRLHEIAPEFDRNKHSVLVINTGNSFLNY